MAPTILYCLRLAVPDDMDGEVLKFIFTDEFLKENRMRYMHKKKSKEEIRNLKNFDKKEEYQIKKRLEDLGYIS